MKPGDQVKIISGRGRGHKATVIAHEGVRVKVRVTSLRNLDGGPLEFSAHVTSLFEEKPQHPMRVADFRPLVVEPLRIARPGAADASRLPSILGADLVYPRGLQA